MSDKSREITVRHETKGAAEADGEQTLNWADFIDSLHEFRAPTPRLARVAYRAGQWADLAGAADGPASGDPLPG